MTPRHLLLPGVLLLALALPVRADDLPKVEKVDLQPLAAQAERVADALELLGEPLPEGDRKLLRAAAKSQDKAKGVAAIQAVLDKRCLTGVHVQPPRSGKPQEILSCQNGPAKPELAEQGWRVFLVKVRNETSLGKVDLRADSPNALPLTQRSTGKPDPKVTSVGQVGKRFLDLMMFNGQPLTANLSGLELEYRIIQVYCRDAGNKEATLHFSLFRDNKPYADSTTLDVVFDAAPAVLVRLKIKDDDGKSVRDGKPILAAFTFADSQGRIYPSQSRRLAPDFNFHQQVYRADGETVALQPGTYTVTYKRGPEYLV